MLSVSAKYTAHGHGFALFRIAPFPTPIWEGVGIYSIRHPGNAGIQVPWMAMSNQVVNLHGFFHTFTLAHPCVLDPGIPCLDDVDIICVATWVVFLQYNIGAMRQQRYPDFTLPESTKKAHY